MELNFRIANDAFETKLDDVVEFALEKIKRFGRDLGQNASYHKKAIHIHFMAWKFNVMMHELISSIHERVLQSDNE